MKRKIVFLFLISLVSFLSIQVTAQNIQSGSLEINGQTYNGFKTNFKFSSKYVDKGFWSYCRSFAKVLNQRTYQEITIPSDNADELVLYSQSVAIAKEQATFTIVLKDNGMSNDIKKKYYDQIKSLLSDFHQQLFLQAFDDRIEKLEKKAETLSRKYSKSNEEQKQSLYEEMKKIEAAIVALRSAQAKIVD